MIHILEELRELKRIVHNLLQEGEVVSETDDSRMYSISFGSLRAPQVVQLRSGSAEGSDANIPLQKGEKVLVAAPSGDLARGRILGVIPRKKIGPPTGDYYMDLPKGGKFRVDAKTGSISITLPEGAELSVKADKVRFSGDLVVEGDISCKNVKASADIDAKNITASADVTGKAVKTDLGIGLSDHVHDVAAPSGNSTTSVKPGGV